MKSAELKIQIKRVYEAAAETDGQRLLVDGLFHEPLRRGFARGQSVRAISSGIIPAFKIEFIFKLFSFAGPTRSQYFVCIAPIA